MYFSRRGCKLRCSVSMSNRIKNCQLLIPVSAVLFLGVSSCGEPVDKSEKGGLEIDQPQMESSSRAMQRSVARYALVQSILANPVQFDGERLTVNGYLLVRSSEPASPSLYLVPQQEWRDLAFSDSELDLLAIRLEIEEAGTLPMPFQCDGQFVQTTGEFESDGRRSRLYLDDRSPMTSREGKSRVPCRDLAEEIKRLSEQLEQEAQ